MLNVAFTIIVPGIEFTSRGELNWLTIDWKVNEYLLRYYSRKSKIKMDQNETLVSQVTWHNGN